MNKFYPRRAVVIVFLGGLLLSFFSLQSVHAQAQYPLALPTVPSPANSNQPRSMMQAPTTTVPQSSATSTPTQSEVPQPTPVPTLPASHFMCTEPSQCSVIAPTVLVPSASHKPIPSNKVVIAGVSYNETKVDVYIDGIYNGRAKMRSDESGVGNFYYYPFLRLTPGEHYAYTVARNLTETARSIESNYIQFTVIAPIARSVAPQPVPIKTEEPITEVQTPTTTPEAPASANNILERFFGIGGTATTSTSTPSFARRLGNILLLLIVIVLIVFAVRSIRARRRPPPLDSGPNEGPPPTSPSPPSV